ncbi:hypothetical protein Cst_c04450 [Thermoclostridium stercorarium subsp. stercorarium DSM 8532]|uniref:Uncharacterized protein n=1 Tax=Thermoclostridium stercorarium (strain ATCC 35414 / DSM 8532 / NCIMB 11754) TaxID=1121335 RepID=L7VL48_THES1|nr:hypothetical protein Cst_c04450 [Thermoclostridium stercorarium subsp. stercorarium DSM 8532]
MISPVIIEALLQSSGYNPLVYLNYNKFEVNLNRYILRQSSPEFEKYGIKEEF